MSSKLAAALGLCLIGVGILVVLAVGGVFIPLGFAFGMVPFAAAALLLVPGRWTPLVAVVVGALFLFGALRASATAARLADPGDVVPFLASVLQIAGAAVAFIAGLRAAFRPR